jgi:uncharacterized membrane protein/uncharacterized membrane protein YbhN (UPF0104 family)
MSQKSDFFQVLKRVAKFFFGIPLTILSFYFIFSILFQSHQEILASFAGVRFLPLIAGFLLLSVFFILRAYIWTQILKKQGHRPPTKKTLYLLSKSELRRYIPGNILAFASRVTVFGSEKIPAKIIIKSLGIEALLFIVSSVVVGIPGIILLFQLTASSYVFSFIDIEVVAIGIALVAFSLGLISYYLFKRFNLTSKKIIDFFVLYRDPYVISLISWIIFGVGNILVAASLTYIDAYKFIPITSFFVLSWLLGYLSFITPMGLGVREAFVIYILSASTPLSVAATTALFLRVILIAAELLTVLILYVVYKAKQFIFPLHLSILFASVASYISYYSYVTFAKHNNFYTGRFDLGNMDQTVWNTLHGRIFTLTNPDGVNIMSRLGIHADFLLIFLAPFYMLWEDPRMLLFLQSAILGFGAIFIYFLSIKIIENKNVSLILSISYLLNPFVGKQNLYDFHAITFATTFLLGTFLFLYLKKYRYFIVFLFLSLLTKENVFLVSAIFGLYLYVKNKKFFGIILFGISIATFYLLISQIIPAFRGADHFAVSYFHDFGNSPKEIIFNILLRPDRILPLFISERAISYLYSLLLPVGFLSLLSPLYLIFAFPDLFINIASKNTNLTNITYHYGAPIIPFIYISAIFGIKKILNKKSNLLTSKNICIYLLFTSLFSAWTYGPLPGSNKPNIAMLTNTIKEGPEIRKLLESIPQDLSVSASNNLGAQLSHREKIYTIPNNMYEADVVVFLLNDSYAQPSLTDQLRFVRDLEYNEKYLKILDVGDFRAFKKVNLEPGN